MAYEEVQDLATDNVIALGGTNRKTGKANPSSIEGYYLGSRDVASSKSKTGLAKIHVFQTAKGNVGVWGKTDLDIKMATVRVGTMTLAKFDKMQATKNGEMYKYKVAVDKSNVIEVAGAVTGDAATDESDETYAAGTAGEASDETEDDDAVQAAELARLERAARVQALLKKGSNKTT